MYYGGLNGVDFEHLVLQRYRGTLKKNEKWTKILNYKSPATKSFEEISPLYREREAKCCGHGSWWWEPPKESILADFCMDSSMHGLRFVSQRKRHLTERIFWAVIFLISVVAATLLINDVWTRYYNNPVIVSFSPNEIGIDDLPFPAVTICNMNKFPKSELDKRLKILKDVGNGKVTKEEEYVAREEIKMIYAACTAQKSFAQQHDFAYNRGSIDPNLTAGELDDISKKEMVEFLMSNTLPCDKLIRFCLWSEDPRDCNEFFKAIVTDFGKCCTFNLLPESLLLRHKLRARNSTRRKGPYVPRWNETEVKDWTEWDYNSDGFNLNPTLKQPKRQYRAGLQHGLSILIDPNVGNNFCPISDSEGVRVMLHPPLEFPHVQEFGTIIGLNQEVFMEIHPEVTMADDDIIGFDVSDRKCLFNHEQSLEFFKPYTASNCMDECVARILRERCNCTQYFMPRKPGTDVCDSDSRSSDYNCTRTEKAKMVDDMETECSHCVSPCDDIAYNFEVTVSTLHDASTLWGDTKNRTKPDWMNNKMSILHMYCGADSTVPKIRKRLYGTTDLIANTGGLLGLCLGFSIMSLIEIVYFLSLRAFWQYKRKKEILKKIANKFMTFVQKSKDKATSKVGIGDQRNQMMFRPAYPNSYSFARTPTDNHEDAFSKFRF